MKNESFVMTVNLPSIEEFTERFPQYGNFAKNDGNFLYQRIITPESYNNAKIVTLICNLPAVDGVANLCYEAVKNNVSVEWEGFTKQFIGAVVCMLMESNGFEKTGKKKSIRNPNFTKGELYQLSVQN